MAIWWINYSMLKRSMALLALYRLLQDYISPRNMLDICFANFIYFELVIWFYKRGYDLIIERTFNMDKMEIPEKYQNMSTEEIVKEIYNQLVEEETHQKETLKLALKASTMQTDTVVRLSKELDAADENYHRLMEEKGKEYRKLTDVIEKTNDKIYDIGMEIAKRAEALENTKH